MTRRTLAFATVLALAEMSMPLRIAAADAPMLCFRDCAQLRSAYETIVTPEWERAAAEHNQLLAAIEELEQAVFLLQARSTLGQATGTVTASTRALERLQSIATSLGFFRQVLRASLGAELTSTLARIKLLRDVLNAPEPVDYATARDAFENLMTQREVMLETTRQLALVARCSELLPTELLLHEVYRAAADQRRGGLCSSDSAVPAETFVQEELRLRNPVWSGGQVPSFEALVSACRTAGITLASPPIPQELGCGGWELVSASPVEQGESEVMSPRLTSSCTHAERRLTIAHRRMASAGPTVDVTFSLAVDPPKRVRPSTTAVVPLELEVAGTYISENAIATGVIAGYRDSVSVKACSLAGCGNEEPLAEGSARVAFPGAPSDPDATFSFNASLSDGAAHLVCRNRYVYAFRGTGGR